MKRQQVRDLPPEYFIDLYRRHGLKPEAGAATIRRWSDGGRVCALGAIIHGHGGWRDQDLHLIETLERRGFDTSIWFAHGFDSALNGLSVEDKTEDLIADLLADRADYQRADYQAGFNVGLVCAAALLDDGEST